MTRFAITLRTRDIENGDTLFQELKREIELDGFAVDSAEESEAAGMTGIEIVISIVVSFGASVAANLAHPKIEAALARVRAHARKPVEVTVQPLLEAEDDAADK